SLLAVLRSVHHERTRASKPPDGSFEEIGPLSSNVIEPPVLPSPEEQPQSARISRPGGTRPTWTAVSPAIMAGAALAAHQLLPNGQLPPLSWMDQLPGWQHPYPLLLGVVMALSVVASVAQLCWRPLCAWSRYYMPLLAGAAFLFGIWD